MSWRRAKVTNANLGTDLLELGVVKVLAIICHNGIWYAKAIYDDGPNETCNFGLSYGCKWLGLSPLGKIINWYNYMFRLSFAHEERSDEVNLPLCK